MKCFAQINVPSFWKALILRSHESTHEQLRLRGCSNMVKIDTNSRNESLPSICSKNLTLDIHIQTVRIGVKGTPDSALPQEIFGVQTPILTKYDWMSRVITPTLRILTPQKVAILRTYKHPCYTGSNPSIGGSLGILRVEPK